MVTWLNHEPFYTACGEHLSTEEADWGCFACGGEGFDDDPDQDEVLGPDNQSISVVRPAP